MSAGWNSAGRRIAGAAVVAPDHLAEMALIEISRMQRTVLERKETEPMETTRFEVITSPTRAPRYALRAVGKRPSWTPTGIFGDYKRKRDAQRRADELNAAEIRRETEFTHHLQVWCIGDRDATLQEELFSGDDVAARNRLSEIWNAYTPADGTGWRATAKRKGEPEPFDRIGW